MNMDLNRGFFYVEKIFIKKRGGNDRVDGDGSYPLFTASMINMLAPDSMRSGVEADGCKFDLWVNICGLSGSARFDWCALGRSL